MNIAVVNKNNLSFNDIEKEIILLKATWDIVSSAVNEIVFNPSKSALFQTSSHQKYFGILITDFLSEPSSILGFDKKYIQELSNVCSTPQFNNRDSIQHLKIAVQNIQNWLGETIPFDKIGHYVDEPMWFPSINKSANPHFSREDIIFIYGNMSKHNFTRLDAVANKIRYCFRKNGVTISKTEALLVLEDLYDHLDDNVFIFHANHIAKHMNKIIWGIFYYLQPEFEKSIQYIGHEGEYKYTFPKNVNNGYAKELYWQLMNYIRSAPYLKDFDFPTDDLCNYYETSQLKAL